MTDLRVDFEVLGDSERSLSSLKSEFDNIEHRRDDTSDIWGHHEVRDAMDEFASNMDHHRENLSKEIEDVGKKVAGTIHAFREADQKLKDELEENTSTDTHRGPR